MPGPVFPTAIRRAQSHRTPRRRWALGRYLARALCLVFGLIGAVPFLLGGLVRTQAVRRWAADETARVLARELGISARYRVTVQAWPMGVTFDDLVVEGSDEKGPVLTATHVSVRPRIFALFASRLDAGQIEIDSPRLRLVVKDGKPQNVVYHLPEPKAGPPARRAPFTSVAVTDARVDLDVDGTHVQGGEIDLDVTAEDGPAFELSLRAGEQSVTRERQILTLGVPESGAKAIDDDLLCKLDAHVRVEPGGVLVRRLALVALADSDPAAGSSSASGGTAPANRGVAPAGRGVASAGHGAVSPGCAGVAAVSSAAGAAGRDAPGNLVDLTASHLRVAFRPEARPTLNGAVHGRLPLGLVNRFVAMAEVRGQLVIDGDLQDQGGTLPDLSGKVSGKGIGLERYQFASDLTADLAIDHGAIRVKHASVGYGDGTVTPTDLVIEPLKKGVPIHIAAVDSNNVRFTGMMRDLGVTPHAHVEWILTKGHIAPIEGTLAPLHLDGEFALQTNDFEVFDRRYDDAARRHMIGVKDARLAGHIVVKPDAVVFRGARADFGDSHLETTVSLGFDNDLVVSIGESSHINLANVSPLGSLKMAGRATLSAEMKGKFNDPVLLGDIAIAGLSLDDLPLGDVTSGKVRFRPLIVDFSDVEAKKNKSSFHVPALRLDFDGPSTMVIDSTVDATELFVRDFLSMFHFDTDPRFDEIAGVGKVRANIHYDLGGAVDRCGGGLLIADGSMSLRSADLFEEHYDGVESKFRYVWADRAAQDLGIDLDIQSLTLKKGHGTIFGSGTIRRGGIVHAQLAADGVPLGRLDAFGKLGKVLDGSISGVGTLGGTIDDLEANVDVTASPIRLGTGVLPASHVKLVLTPVPREVKVVGHSHCGQPLTAPFDRADYDRDAVVGVFHAKGSMFAGQVGFDDLRVTRQRKKSVAGGITFDKLDAGVLTHLSPNASATSVDVSGTLSGGLQIDSLPMASPERSRAVLTLSRLDLAAGGARLALHGTTQPMAMADDKLVVPGVSLDLTSAGGLRGAVNLGGEIKKLSSAPEVNLALRVPPVDLAALAPVIPRLDRASGTVEAQLSMTGKLAAPTYGGEAHVKRGELVFRGFDMPLSNVNVDISVGGGEVRIVRGSALVGGGSVAISGEAPVHGLDLGSATAVITARGVHVTPTDGVALAFDADLTASFPEAAAADEERPRPTLEGDVVLTSFNYTRPITMSADIGSLAQRSRRKVFDAYDPNDDWATFDVRLRSREPLRLRNNLLDAQLALDPEGIAFTGTNQRYGMRGQLRILPAGRVRFRTSEFEIRQGYVRFDDPHRVAPNVDVTAVTDYRRYSASAATGAPTGAAAGGAASGVGRSGGTWRITLHAFGDADDLKLELASEPALSQEDIVLLLTLGMTRAEIDQLQASSLGGTAALEALSAFTGADSAVKKAVPIIDDFGFGSAYSSITGRTEPTITVGKRVTDRVRANVTSGLSENREIRTNLEWKLTPKVSVQGSYDNVNDVSSSSFGNLGADVRWRLEFE